MTTRVTTAADGSTAAFSIPFPYLDRSHVKVMLDGVTQPTTAYTWVTNATIALTPTPAAGVKVTRYRETPSDPLTVYQSGSVLTRDQLEVDSLQALFRTEEAEERALRLPADHVASTLLPTLVPTAPLVVKADGTGFEMGDLNLTGDMLLRSNLAGYGEGAGSDMVGVPDTAEAPAYLQTVSDIFNGLPISLHRFLPPAQLAAIRAGTSTYDCGNDIRAALLDTDIVSLYVPKGLHNYSGNLTRGATSLHLRGESSKDSILRCVGAGGLVFNGGNLDGVGWRAPVLDISDLWIEAAVANAGNAVTMNYTGGSGEPPLGPTFRDVNIACRTFGEHWNTAIRGTNVRNMHAERVMLAGAFAAAGWPAAYLMTGMVMDGNDDPVELWLDGLYAYYIERPLDVGGHYEGIYVDRMHTVGCKHGVRWAAAVPNPVIMVQNSYIATEHSGVDLDQVSYFRIQNNVFNPTSPVPHANYEGVIVRRTVGNQTQASDIVGNSFVGVGYSDTTAYTETAVLLENANTVRVDHNTVYDMNVGVKGVAGTGNRIGPNNRYIGVDTPEDVPQAMRTGEISPECVFKASRNASNQTVNINTLTQVVFDTIGRDDKGYYNATAGAFTPPAGHYRVRGRLRISDAVAGDFLGVYITVAGTTVEINGAQAAVAGLHVIEVNGTVEVDGTQAIAIAINVETGVGGATRTVFAQDIATRFEAEAVTG